MKAVNVKKLGWVGLSLVLLTLASCGSDNKAVEVQTNTASPDTSGSTSTTTGVSSCVTVSNFNDFKANVVAGNFVSQSSTREQYTYGECEYFWSGVGTKCLSSFKRSSNSDVENITHEMAATRTELLSDLSTIVNSASDTLAISSTRFRVEVSGGDIYDIDLCRPLTANPVKFQDDDGYYELKYIYSY